MKLAVPPFEPPLQLALDSYGQKPVAVLKDRKGVVVVVWPEGSADCDIMLEVAKKANERTGQDG